MDKARNILPCLEEETGSEDRADTAPTTPENA